MTLSTDLPTIAHWKRDDPDGATPPCPDCGRLLGIRLAMFTRSGRDAWICDDCNKEFSG